MAMRALCTGTVRTPGLAFQGCLASGLPGSLTEPEASVARVETEPVLAKAARQAPPEVSVKAVWCKPQPW